MAEAVRTGVHFMQGNRACAEGAIAAGCRFFAGYPITPSSEIAEHMARRLPQVGGVYAQMEDELASLAAVLGASNAGVKAMTATSGPGFSLMLENLGLGVMLEAPCVIVNVQRTGPSTGMPTLFGQADVMQARWGSHGDYEIVAYAPGSVQEMFDLTVAAFNTAERFRTPVVVLADKEVGHMVGRVRIPPPEELEVVDRARPPVPPGDGYRPYDPEMGRKAGLPPGVPVIPNAGDGYRVHLTGLTHDERGYPLIRPEAHRRLMDRLLGKIRDNRAQIVRLERDGVEEADLLVLSYGTTARAAWKGVQEARDSGLRVGFVRLITLWPFPEEAVAALSEGVRGILVVEGNYGQMVHPVREHARCPVFGCFHPGGTLISPRQVLEGILEMDRKTR